MDFESNGLFGAESLLDSRPISVEVDFRDHYVQRVQSLDKFKKRFEADFFGENSRFGSLVETATITKENNQFCNANNASFFAAMFQLKSAMLDVMDKDVGLMRYLISINDSVESLKLNSQSQCSTQELSPAPSILSLAEEMDSVSQLASCNTSISSGSARQYFSRQNSILRIPITPRHFRNVKTKADFPEDSDDTSSGVSSHSTASSSSSSSVATITNVSSNEQIKPVKADFLVENNSEKPQPLIIQTDNVDNIITTAPSTPVLSSPAMFSAAPKPINQIASPSHVADYSIGQTSSHCSENNNNFNNDEQSAVESCQTDLKSGSQKLVFSSENLFCTCALQQQEQQSIVEQESSSDEQPTNEELSEKQPTSCEQRLTITPPKFLLEATSSGSLPVYDYCSVNVGCNTEVVYV